MSEREGIAAIRARVQRLVGVTVIAPEERGLAGESPERIHTLVAEEAARLIGGSFAGILRLDGESKALVMGSWADRDSGIYEPGTRSPAWPITAHCSNG